MSVNYFRVYKTDCTLRDCEKVCEAESQRIKNMTDFMNMPRKEGVMDVLMNSALRKYDDTTLPIQNINTDPVFGIFTKGLPHNEIGDVLPDAFESFKFAIENGSGHPEYFDKIKTSGSIYGSGYRKLVNPQAGLAMDLEGYDSHFFVAAPCPKIKSEEAVDELIENYWMSLTRDVNFSEYSTNPLTISAAEDLSQFESFYGPKIDGKVTPQTLFRCIFEGNTVGPYISQFLYLNVPFGASFIEQKITTYLPNTNCIKDFATFLKIENGMVPKETEKFDPTMRYIRNGRDLSQWVHIDVLYQAYLNAMLLLSTSPSAATRMCGMKCPLSPNNPYASTNPSSKNQIGFGTFGDTHLQTILTEVAQRALKACWYQKFFIQQRLRPEEMAALVYKEHNGIQNYGLNKDYLKSSYFDQPNSNYILEQAYPEGAPLHPSYLAGHAAVAGACVTILKAWFKTDVKFSDLGITPMVPNVNRENPDLDGTFLVPYEGSDKNELTVFGELQKLACNISIGRNIAGVHYRADHYESILFGEEIAISILNDQKHLYNEFFKGWSLKKFDGSVIII
jgi:hypothetical protein